MKRILCILLLATFAPHGWAQEEDTLYVGAFQDIKVLDKESQRKIREYKRRLKRVYPMAMHASALISEYDQEISQIEKKRKVKKYGKDAYKGLKKEFKYTILQTYQGDGIILMKLIQKETGLTVHEIIKKFRGNGQAMLFQVMAKMWDNDLKTDYDPESNKWDWAIEVALEQLEESGELEKLKLDIITKEEHKEIESKRKERAKNRRKRKREVKREARKKRKEEDTE